MGKIKFLVLSILVGLVWARQPPSPSPQDEATCKKGLCVPPISCSAHVRNHAKKFCKTPGGRQGVCCTTGQNHTDYLETKNRAHSIKLIDSNTLSFLHRHSDDEMSDMRSAEVRLLNSKYHTVLKPGSPSYTHTRNSRTFDETELTEMMSVANRALQIAIATRIFKDRQGLSNEQLELGMLEHNLKPTPLGKNCALKPFCSEELDRFRRIDGACNNIANPSWGSPLSPYQRLLPPSYHDGIWIPRKSQVNDKPLPSPRLISTTVFQDADIPNPEFTLMVMQFGQFFSHDITHSIDTLFANGSAISCCTENGQQELHPHFRHFACMPISIPKKDPFYAKFGQRCMNFVRSVLAPRHDCTLGYSQQMNKITHFIDCSSIYGSSPEQTSELRSFEGGKLNVFNDFGRDLLPLTREKDDCLTMEQGSACFTSGDTRTNQMVSLVALHTVFLREHNRVASYLGQMNPHWNDERIFLETRQIVMAEMQVVIYKEFLPAVIGEEAMETFGLRLGSATEYSKDYSPEVEPSVTNEFASAALRFGHSTVDGLLKIYGPQKMEEMIDIPEVMFSPARMRKREFFDEILNTMTSEPIQEVDGWISDSLTKYMFRGGNPFGVDLAAINIQRGRDHGLRPFNDYRELSGVPKIKTFEEFGPEYGPKLSAVYASVDDIDLWVGGLLEPKVAGSLVGPVFRDIIADQFVRLKRGDRYFFENDPSINPGHFTPDQLATLRQTSMARIICDNNDRILLHRLAPNSFRRPGVEGNEFVHCDGPEIPSVALHHWHEV